MMNQQKKKQSTVAKHKATQKLELHRMIIPLLVKSKHTRNEWKNRSFQQRMKN